MPPLGLAVFTDRTTLNTHKITDIPYQENVSLGMMRAPVMCPRVQDVMEVDSGVFDPTQKISDRDLAHVRLPAEDCLPLNLFIRR